MKSVIQGIFCVIAFVSIFAAVLAFFALLLWWLVPLAFPLLPFGYGQALALTGLLAVIGLPTLAK